MGLGWRHLLLLLGATGSASACDLCAVYSADNARQQRSAGFVFTLSESFISYHTVQLNGKEVPSGGLGFRDTSITHLVPGYNFSERFGLNLNLPLVYHDFKRSEIRYTAPSPPNPPSPPVFQTEQGTEFGLGDISLIGRLALFEVAKMKYSFGASLLAGVKFPTGDTDRIQDEVEQTQIYEDLLPPGTPHDPLAHTLSGVHQHDLSPGSGSFDGIFGLTLRSRWDRWFFNGQVQYYLRTEGESSFRYGNEIMVSGGPGAYLLLRDEFSLSLQANAGYDSMARDELLGRHSALTGLTAWYLGPQVSLTWGERFIAVGGVDIPLHITSNGRQNVPDYRIHGSLVWRF